MRLAVLTCLVAVFACDAHSHRPAGDAATPHPTPLRSEVIGTALHSDVISPVVPPRELADSVLNRYLGLIAERDGFAPDQFSGIHSYMSPCIEEEYGDSFSSYWLARGRVLGYDAQADTLRARLELLTVAVQEPSADSAYGSVVTARIRTDTLVLKLVPDSSRRRWQTCGLLSDGHMLGGYGRPDNVRFSPATFTRAVLVRQVDSIRNAAASR